MTTPQGHPQREPPARLRAVPPPRSPHDADLRAQIEALAEQVRRLANVSGPAEPSGATVEAGGATVEASSATVEAGGATAEPSGATVEPAAAADRPEPPRQVAAPPPAESLGELSDRLLGEVLAMAELAATEIRAAAEREADDIRERAGAAIREADQALERYREALGGLALETERIERAIVALAEQGRALDTERRAIEQALRAARPR